MDLPPSAKKDKVQIVEKYIFPKYENELVTQGGAVIWSIQ